MTGTKHIYCISEFIFLVFLGCISTICTASQMNQRMDHEELDGRSNKFTLYKTFLNVDFLETIPIESQLLARYDSLKLRDNRIFKESIGHLNKNSSSQESEENKENWVKVALPTDKFVNEVFLVSREYNIDPLLLHAIAEIESQYKPDAISPAGAKGLMQVMPKTAQRFGMEGTDAELFDPISNLRVSSNYLRMLHKLFGNNIPLILAAYNAGENAVIKYGYTIPPYGETQMYVTKVMKRYLELKSMSYSM